MTAEQTLQVAIAAKTAYHGFIDSLPIASGHRYVARELKRIDMTPRQGGEHLQRLWETWLYTANEAAIVGAFDAEMRHADIARHPRVMYAVCPGF